MGHKNKKRAEKPQGNCLAIYWRLFHQYAGKYWGRLLLGILAGLTMGGAMRAYFSFLDFGVSNLGGEKKQADGIVRYVEESRLGKWLIRKIAGDTSTSAHKNKIEVVPEKQQQPTTEKTPVSPSSKDEKAMKKSHGLFDKINKTIGHFGIQISESDTLSFPVMVIIILGIAFFFGLQSMATFVNKYFLQWVGSRVVTDLRQALFENLQKQSLAFHSKHDVGQLISRCTNDAAGISHAFTNCIAELFISPMTFLVAGQFVIQKALENGLIRPTIIMLILFPVCIVPIYILSKFLRGRQHEVLGRVAVLTERMQENLSGIRVVKAFHQEKREGDRFKIKNHSYFRAVIRAMVTDIFMTPTMQVLSLILIIVFVILCYQQHVSILSLAVMGIAAQQMNKPMKELAKINGNLQNCAASAERIFQALDFTEVIPEPENPEPLPSFQHEIVFEHVNFSYEPDGPLILKDFCLTIHKGEHVAIVGPTGSGKTTVANLLARFYDPTSGRILIDGHDLRNISNDDLRKLLGITAQENFLFNEDIAFNIAYGRPNATMEEIRDAADRANATEFINAEPEGFQRQVGERGCLLSGGQKQRIAIARALLTNPPILILDEATSALDTVTEQKVQSAINELMKERTVLSIAHRLSTIINSDQILVLDRGEIVEKGTHQELYDLNGKYRMFYDRQTSEPNEA